MDVRDYGEELFPGKYPWEYPSREGSKMKNASAASDEARAIMQTPSLKEQTYWGYMSTPYRGYPEDEDASWWLITSKRIPGDTRVLFTEGQLETLETQPSQRIRLRVSPIVPLVFNPRITLEELPQWVFPKRAFIEDNISVYNASTLMDKGSVVIVTRGETAVGLGESFSGLYMPVTGGIYARSTLLTGSTTVTSKGGDSAHEETTIQRRPSRFTVPNGSVCKGALTEFFDSSDGDLLRSLREDTSYGSNGDLLPALGLHDLTAVIPGEGLNFLLKPSADSVWHNDNYPDTVLPIFSLGKQVSGKAYETIAHPETGLTLYSPELLLIQANNSLLADTINYQFFDTQSSDTPKHHKLEGEPTPEDWVVWYQELSQKGTPFYIGARRPLDVYNFVFGATWEKAKALLPQVISDQGVELGIAYLRYCFEVVLYSEMEDLKTAHFRACKRVVSRYYSKVLLTLDLEPILNDYHKAMLGLL